ncbi:MAG: TssQ family T6SS-associated lipoprotein [Pseudomonadota bacterium]
MNNIVQHNKRALLQLIMLVTCVLMQACESPPIATPTPAPVPVQKAPIKHKEVKPAATLATPAPAEPARAAPVGNADVNALKEGIAMYNDGDYSGTIKKLGSATEIWNSQNKSIQVSALKYLAFSYCVTSRTQLCRQQFERALKIDPSFDLLPSEIGHPIWGPVFLKAKKPK